MSKKSKKQKLGLDNLANLANLAIVSINSEKPIIESEILEKKQVSVVVEEFPLDYDRETKFYAVAPNGYHYDRIQRHIDWKLSNPLYRIWTGEYEDWGVGQQKFIKFRSGQELLDLGWKICASYDEAIALVKHPLQGKEGNWKDAYAWANSHLEQVQAFIDKGLGKWNSMGDFLILSQVKRNDFDCPSEVIPNGDNTIFLDSIGRAIATLAIKSEEYISRSSHSHDGGEVGIGSWHDKGYW